MTVKVKVKYATMPNGTPNSNTTVMVNTTDTSYSALERMIKAQHPGWYNIQILDTDC